MKAKFNEIAEELRLRIERREYTDRLPSEQELAGIFGSTTITVRKALDVLSSQGIIRKIPCVGAFVNHAERKTIRIAWQNLSLKEETTEAIRQTMRRNFRDFTVEFITCDSDEFSTDGDFDLIKTAATFYRPYSDAATPFPRATIDKFRDEAYIQPPFDVHRVNGFLYALPLFYSPALLGIDRRTAEKKRFRQRPIRARHRPASRTRHRTRRGWEEAARYDHAVCHSLQRDFHRGRSGRTVGRR